MGFILAFCSISIGVSISIGYGVMAGEDDAPNHHIHIIHPILTIHPMLYSLDPDLGVFSENSGHDMYCTVPRQLQIYSCKVTPPQHTMLMEGTFPLETSCPEDRRRFLLFWENDKPERAVPVLGLSPLR